MLFATLCTFFCTFFARFCGKICDIFDLKKKRTFFDYFDYFDYFCVLRTHQRMTKSSFKKGANNYLLHFLTSLFLHRTVQMDTAVMIEAVLVFLRHFCYFEPCLFESRVEL